MCIRVSFKSALDRRPEDIKTLLTIAAK